MITSHRVLAAAAAAGTAVLLLSGCVAKSDAQATAAFDVSSTATDCAVSASTAKSGTLTFDVTNDTDQVSEFYLLAEDGLRIVGEVENIAPAASRTLTVVAQPGEYFTQLRHRKFPGGAALRMPALVLAMAWYRLRDVL